MEKVGAWPSGQTMTATWSVFPRAGTFDENNDGGAFMIVIRELMAAIRGEGYSGPAVGAVSLAAI